MAPGFDELVERLLHDVALSGSHGKLQLRVVRTTTNVVDSENLE